MDVRTQTAKRWRADDLKRTVTRGNSMLANCSFAYNPIPQLNTNLVNTTCYQPPWSLFVNLVNFTWNHEAAHMAAVEIEAAKSLK